MKALLRAFFVLLGLVGIVLFALGCGLAYAKAPEGWWLLTLGVGCILALGFVRENSGSQQLNR